MAEQPAAIQELDPIPLHDQSQEHTTNLQIDVSVVEVSHASQPLPSDEKSMEGLAYFIELHKEQITKRENKIQKALQILNSSSCEQSERIEKAIDCLNDLQTSALYPHVNPVKSISYQSQSADGLEKQIWQEQTLNMIQRKDKEISVKQQEILRLQQASRQFDKQFLEYSTEKETKILQLQECLRNDSIKHLNLVQELGRLQKQLQTTTKELESSRQLFQTEIEGYAAKQTMSKANTSQQHQSRQTQQLREQISSEREAFKKRQEALLQVITKLQQKCCEESIKSIEIPCLETDEELDTLKLQIEELKRSNKDLTIQLDVQKRQNEQRSKQLSISRLQESKQIEHNNNNRDEFEKILKAAQSQKQTIRIQLNALSGKLKQQENAKKTCLLQSESKQQQLNQEIHNLKSIIMQKNEELKEITVLKHQCKLSAQTITALSAQVQTLKKQLSHMDSTVVELTGKLQNQEAKLKMMIENEKKINKQMQQTQELKRASQNASLQTKKLQDKCEKVSQKYEFLKQRYRKDTKDSKEGFFRHMNSLMRDMDGYEMVSFKEAIKITLCSSGK